VDKIGKEHFTSLYSPAREKALSKRNILAGWAATGLFPFNLERVFRHTPRPLDVTTVPDVVEVVTSNVFPMRAAHPSERRSAKHTEKDPFLALLSQELPNRIL
jgi:hypothetical protein